MNAQRAPHDPGTEPQPGIVRVYSFLDQTPRFLNEVLAGLSTGRKSLPFRWRYDTAGMAALDAWSAGPENYLQRHERALLKAHLPEASVIIGPDVELLEMGPGCGLQTGALLEDLRVQMYLDIGVDRMATHAVAQRLAAAWPQLHIAGLLADPLQAIVLPEFSGVPLRKKACYLSALTTGSYFQDDLSQVLRHVRRLVGTGGALIAGLDLKKNRKVLEAVGNDPQGLAAQWNASLLHRINRELGGDFQAARFRHVAVHNEMLSCTGYYLESLYEQFVHVNGQRFDFTAGEVMLSGLATQYGAQDFEALAVEAGFKLQKLWVDEQKWVGVGLLMGV
jgi:L-histidine N-alpha-methyltransferase